MAEEHQVKKRSKKQRSTVSSPEKESSILPLSAPGVKESKGRQTEPMLQEKVAAKAGKKRKGTEKEDLGGDDGLSQKKTKKAKTTEEEKAQGSVATDEVTEEPAQKVKKERKRKGEKFSKEQVQDEPMVSEESVEAVKEGAGHKEKEKAGTQDSEIKDKKRRKKSKVGSVVNEDARPEVNGGDLESAVEEPNSTKATKKKMAATKERSDKSIAKAKSNDEPQATASPGKKVSRSSTTEQDELDKSTREPTTKNMESPSKLKTYMSSHKALSLAPLSAQHLPSGDEGDASSPEGSVHLHGFSDSEDSSDEEDFAVDGPGIDLGKLPTIPKDDATVKQRLDKAKRKPTEDRGVLYLGRLPHGFYEDQMRGYFSQFGEVTRLRLSRNKKTGHSKHYAFIEFASSEVAKIVAETMDNYLLLGHILRCTLIPKDEVHPELWVGANRKWRMVPRDRIARVQHNKPRTSEEQETAERRLIKRQDAKKRKLEELGIKYNMDAVSYKRSKPIAV